MMSLPALYDILAETTVQLRKGPEIVQRQAGVVEVTEVFAMPHVSDAKPNLELVDLELLTIGVDKARAEAKKDTLIALLKEFPDKELLASGPSYISVGYHIGDQGTAFQLFALGKVLGLWDIITPANFHVTGEKAREMAGVGYIMITGFKDEQHGASNQG